MRFILLSFFLLSLSFSFEMHAQSYHSALGLRIGNNIGFTYQQRVGKNQTIESILQTGLFRNSGQFAVLFEQHNSLISRGFNFYYGGGPHIGWYENRQEMVIGTVGGLAFIVGAEMSLGSIILSYDIKPAINLFGNAPIINFDTALSVRTALVKKSKFSKRNKNGWFNSGKNNNSSKRERKPLFKKKTHKL